MAIQQTGVACFDLIYVVAVGYCSQFFVEDTPVLRIELNKLLMYGEVVHELAQTQITQAAGSNYVSLPYMDCKYSLRSQILSILSLIKVNFSKF
jgi:hypothetical protein